MLFTTIFNELPKHSLDTVGVSVDIDRFEFTYWANLSTALYRGSIPLTATWKSSFAFSGANKTSYYHIDDEATKYMKPIFSPKTF
jgi:hypothetical protein